MKPVIPKARCLHGFPLVAPGMRVARGDASSCFGKHDCAGLTSDSFGTPFVEGTRQGAVAPDTGILRAAT
jgi:hypothetical protein